MVYAPLFQLGPDTTDYEFLGSEGVGRETWRGARWLLVQQESLASLAELALHASRTSCGQAIWRSCGDTR